MIRLDRILFPTDFSDDSRGGLEYACAFAERFNAELHLLHVLQDVIAMVPEPGMAFPPPGNYMEELRENAEQTLARLPGGDWEEGKTVVREVREGPPFLEIVRYAKQNEVDLIVISTHGRSGLSHILLGSVTEKVVRKAPCPVLTVRPSRHEFTMP